MNLRSLVRTGGLLMGLIGATVALESGSFAATRPGTAMWRAYDSGGVSLQYPADWAVKKDPLTGRVEVTGEDHQSLTLWPLFVPQLLDEERARAVLRGILMNVYPQLTWEAPAAIAPHAVSARSSSLGAAAAFLFWSPTAHATSAYFYLLRAPSAREVTAATAAQIFDSFRARRSETPATAPLSLVRWSDPREGAFSLELPAGWNVSGGLFRFSTRDVRPAWRATSPRGDLEISGGDANVPIFTAPNPTLQGAGYRDGTWFAPPGDGTRFFVKRYLPGAAFARDFVAQRFASTCSQLALGATAARTDAVAALTAAYAGSTTRANVSAGEVRFTCRRNDALVKGYVFAVTERVAGTGHVRWSVPYAFGYLAREPQVRRAEYALRAAVTSLKLDPAWEARQERATLTPSGILARALAAVSAVLAKTVSDQPGASSWTSGADPNARRELLEVIDPQRGPGLRIQYGASYDWIAPDGTIAGTQADAKPNVSFRRLGMKP